MRRPLRALLPALALVAATAVPVTAAHAAEVVGRAAASAKHVVASAFKKLPGR